MTISSRRRDSGKMVEVEIRDTGIGIPKEHLENLFEPFFSTKAEGKGVGLGLSVSYGIISKHEGSIQVESSSRAGHHLLVLLPIKKGVGD